MAFSSGTFTRIYNFVTDKGAGIKPQASRFDAEFDGIATGLSQCVLKDGSQTVTGDIPMNDHKFTGLGDATAATDALNRQTADARYLGAAAITSVASATTCNIGAAVTPHVSITGTTTITGFGTTANVVRLVTFADALTLTHNATSLILPGAANITTAAGDTAIFASDGSGNWRCYSYTKAAALLTGAPDVIIEDQKASGTNGGTATSGSRQTRTLNTLVRNVNSIASLSSNDFTLPAGSYYFVWSAPAHQVSMHRTYIYNVTDATDVAYGTSEYSYASTPGSYSRSVGSVCVTITGAKAFRLQHRVNTSSAGTLGYGWPAGIGSEIETYSRVEIWRLA